VFAVDEWGYAYTTDPQGNVAAADEPAAREAIAGCPEHAITET
jgi:ferredoxin